MNEVISRPESLPENVKPITKEQFSQLITLTKGLFFQARYERGIEQAFYYRMELGDKSFLPVETADEQGKPITVMLDCQAVVKLAQLQAERAAWKTLLSAVQNERTGNLPYEKAVKTAYELAAEIISKNPAACEAKDIESAQYYMQYIGAQLAEKGALLLGGENRTSKALPSGSPMR